MSDDLAERRQIVRLDWVVGQSRNVLHSIEPTEEQWARSSWVTFFESDIRAACGRMLKEPTVPGIFARMAAPRCKGCCRATAMPEGIGSPKNDDACRAILGLNPSRP